VVGGGSFFGGFMAGLEEGVLSTTHDKSLVGIGSP
jgi:hypothetical protein